MNPGRNLSVFFTNIADATASTEKLMNFIRLYTKCDLIFSWKKRYQLILVTILILVPSLQKCLANFCNSFLVNLENFPIKGNSKY